MARAALTLALAAVWVPLAAGNIRCTNCFVSGGIRGNYAGSAGAGYSGTKEYCGSGNSVRYSSDCVTSSNSCGMCFLSDCCTGSGSSSGSTLPSGKCYQDGNRSRIIDTSDCPNECCVNDVCGDKDLCDVAKGIAAILLFLLIGIPIICICICICICWCMGAACFAGMKGSHTSTTVIQQPSPYQPMPGQQQPMVGVPAGGYPPQGSPTGYPQQGYNPGPAVGGAYPPPPDAGMYPPQK
eukprot:TRINITY_DN6394_c0_g2_i1.p1 TRINITY_DN6394_c0_g2~~TRINITY_DN6394_c0_g2_i1.p1  ORF type:complete len:239 (+),score=52.42 TRINITY_DN6394_c0_g2_i1:83-799(+)